MSLEQRQQRALEVSPQQRTVLRLTSYGLTATEIGRKLSGISENTVKRHLRNVYWRLDATNAPHAVRLAFERRILRVRDTLGFSALDAVRFARLGRVTNREAVRIAGYQRLTAEEVDLINQVKRAEESLALLWQQLADRLPDAHESWLHVGRLRFQEGFMALVRAIARPNDPFELPPR